MSEQSPSTFPGIALAGKFAGILAAIALGLGSCASETPQAAPPTESDPAEEKIKIVTTIIPITQFAKAVAGDRAEVVQLLPINTGPHDYQAKPADVLTIAEADVFIQNGLELEAFLEDTIANADNADLLAIDTSDGVTLLAFEEPEAGEGHDGHGSHEGHNDHDDHDDHAREKHGDEGHSESTAGGHDHGEFDPHIWLDPKRAIQQVENIRAGLIAADPTGEADYTANAAAYIEDLQALDAEISASLAPHAGRTFVAFHDFASYFAASYNLEAEFLVDFPEESPSPEDVKRIIETVKASGLKTVLTEPQAGNTFAALAGDLNIGIGEFDPMEVGSSEALQPGYYLKVMRQNAENLAAAFGESP